MLNIRQLLLALMCILLSNIEAKAQNEFNPYNEALKNFIINTLNNDIDTTVDTFYILKKEVITDNLIKSIDYKNRIANIKLITSEEILKTKIKYILEIMPLQMIDKSLSIDIVASEVEINKHKKINLVNSGTGIRYIIYYDCKLETYLLKV